MTNTMLMILVAAIIVIPAVAFGLALRRRWLSRFSNGFVLALMIALGGTGFGTAVALGMWGYVSARHILFGQLVEGLSNVGEAVESQVDRDISNTGARFASFGDSDLMRSAMTDPEKARTQIETLMQLNRRVLEISLYDREGKTILRTAQSNQPEEPDRQAIGLAQQGKLFISEPRHSKVLNRYVIYLGAPVLDKEKHPIGSMAIRYDLQAALADMVGNLKFGQTGYVVLVDGTGHVIAHPDPTQVGRDVSSWKSYQEAQHAPQGWASGIGSTGQQTLFIYRQISLPSTLPGKPLLLLTDLDFSEAIAPFKKLEYEFLLGIGAIVLFWMLCAKLIARHLTRPLTSLLGLLRRVQENDLTVRSKLHGRDEFGRFAEAFNAMVQGLADRDRIKQIFGRYVTTQVSERILKGAINMGGESRNVTILFSDIRNFTGMSEGMTPACVVEFLNEYFSEMVDAVFEHGGVLDKFIGDGMLATFGSVDDHPDHARRAVQAALQMKERLAGINEDRVAQKRPPINIGIGIHTDNVIVGNIGSRKRSEYTVIGDGVNTCSRVEAMNKDFGTTVLITQNTYECIHDEFECRAMPETKLRGKTQALKLFEVIQATEPGRVAP